MLSAKMALTNHNRAFWREFIQMYRDLPELWKVKSEVYKNRLLKNAAYEKLVEKMREIDQNADRIAVRNKINVLRTGYRRELKKLNDSIRSGSEEIYVPSLWYFFDIDFLRELETLSPADETSGPEETQEFFNGDSSPTPIQATPLIKAGHKRILPKEYEEARELQLKWKILKEDYLKQQRCNSTSRFSQEQHIRRSMPWHHHLHPRSHLAQMWSENGLPVYDGSVKPPADTNGDDSDEWSSDRKPELHEMIMEEPPDDRGNGTRADDAQPSFGGRVTECPDDRREGLGGASFDDVDLLFLSYSRTVKKFTPRRQAIVKYKFAKIMMEEEIMHYEKD